MAKKKYYCLDKILECDCNYNVIYGKKSNGKTYALLKYIIERYCKYGETGVYVRRYRQEFNAGRAAALFAGHVQNGVIWEMSDGKYNTVIYKNSKWFLAFYNEHENSYEYDESPFCYAQALTEQRNGASITVPTCTTLVFDEFINRNTLDDEFFIFNILVSNIKRDRDNLHVFLLGNNIDTYSPYFDEMGLTNIKKQQDGTIDVYTYGDSGNKCAVERTDSSTGADINDRYFAFNNPKLKMITSGEWAIDFYPQCHTHYEPSNIVYRFFIEFDGLHMCECVDVDGVMFINIVPKTRGKNADTDLLFSLTHAVETNVFHDIRKFPKIWQFFESDRVVYSSNIVGDKIRHFLDKMGA